MRRGWSQAARRESSELEAYREWLTAAGLSPRTIRVYRHQLTRAMEWAESRRLDLRAMAPTQLAEMAMSFAPSTSTRRQLRTSLKYYYEMVGRRNPGLKAIRVPPKPHYRNRALSREDARALAKAAELWHPEGTAVMFALYMGLRVSEIAAAEWGRIDGPRYTVTGKRSETYTLPVHERLESQLRIVRRTDPFIFPGSRGRDHVTPTTVWGWIKKVATEAGIGDVQPHQLRHTAITEVNDRTGNIRLAQEFARHKDIATTRIYTRVTEEQLSDAVAKIDYFED